MRKYGQHFLINEGVINLIVDAAGILKAQQWVEIGPGRGALTFRMLERGYTKLTLVEIDPDMVSFLKANMPPANEVRIVQKDFLKFDWGEIPPVPTTFVSNLPYIDAADILDKVLQFEHFRAAVFMFQKEQAQRIRAKAGEEFYGPLSIFSQLRAVINPLCKVGKHSFNPPPKVESAVLTFERLPQVEVSRENWKKFEKMVSSVFLHRRKTITNALYLAGYCAEKLMPALEKTSISPKARPEQISPEKYVQLFRHIG